MNIEDHILDIPDFPKKGVVFKDISPLLRDHFQELLNQMGELINWDRVDLVAGIESRGFILGAALAAKHQKGFVLIRKKGKLPPPVLSHSYQLEYGEDILEIKENKERRNILILDDVLATGGTLNAAAHLCEKANYNIVDMLVLIDLRFLNSFEWKGLKVKSLLHYN